MLITIDKLRVRTEVGVHDWEIGQPRDIYITLAIEMDGEKAMQSGKLDDTLDYCELSKNIVETIEAKKFTLVESIVDLVLEMALALPKAKHVEVEVFKPTALATYGGMVSVKESRSH